MRNDTKNQNLTKRVSSLTAELPCFGIDNLKITEINSSYLRRILSRLTKRGELVRLKKGFYVSSNFIRKTKIENKYSPFLEFLANKIYHPSYLSLEYVLSFHNLLTEAPVNFTAITKKKPVVFSNHLGNFIYRHVKDELFLGFETSLKKDFPVKKASCAKALFDFLYLRKGEVVNTDAFDELRLNLEVLTEKDKKELKKYIEMEGSKKMKEIFGFITSKQYV